MKFGKSVQQMKGDKLIEWNTFRKRRLVELVSHEEGFSEREIADALTLEWGINVTRDAVHNKIRDLDIRSYEDKPVTDPMPYYNKYRDIYEDESVVIPKTFTLDNGVFLGDKKEKLRILYIGDLHIPFQVDSQIQEAINRNLNADMVVTTELMDCYSVSRFNKEMSIPLEVEIDNTVRYLEYLSETFPCTIVMLGNHEARVGREFYKNTNPSLLFLVENNILKVLSKPFKNVIVVEQPYVQINDAVFVHAEKFSAVDLKAGVGVYNFLNEWKESLNLQDFRLCVQSHCLSEDTEVLTEEGWKGYKDISDESRVLTLNTNKDKLEYNKVNKIFKYSDYTEMIQFGGTNRSRLDILVTPEHRMIYSRKDGKYLETTASKFTSGTISIAGDFEGKDVPYSDNFIRFIGLFIAEGGFTNGDSSGIRIYQSKNNCKYIEDLLTSLKLEYTLYTKKMKGREVAGYESRDDENVYYIKASGIKEFHSIMKGVKDIPKELMSISDRQFKLLLEGMMFGDGHYNGKGGQYFTSSKSIADHLQELCIKHNIRATVSNRGKSQISSKDNYCVSWCSIKDVYIDSHRGSKRTVPYSGMVWCVNVDNGTIVTRRNGKVAIVGNTHMLGSTYRGFKAKIMEGGCVCKIPSYAVDKTYAKPQNNGYITVVQNKGVSDFNLCREYIFDTPVYNREDLKCTK
jgi:hypothetical protein